MAERAELGPVETPQATVDQGQFHLVVLQRGQGLGPVGGVDDGRGGVLGGDKVFQRAA
jgi:hypothetical protein